MRTSSGMADLDEFPGWSPTGRQRRLGHDQSGRHRRHRAVVPGRGSPPGEPWYVRHHGGTARRGYERSSARGCESSTRAPVAPSPTRRSWNTRSWTRPVAHQGVSWSTASMPSSGAQAEPCSGIVHPDVPAALRHRSFGPLAGQSPGHRWGPSREHRQVTQCVLVLGASHLRVVKAEGRPGVPGRLRTSAPAPWGLKPDCRRWFRRTRSPHGHVSSPLGTGCRR